MERTLQHELLDHDEGSPHEVAEALRSLRWVNSYFGGNRLHTALLRAAAAPVPGPELHILESACGHAVALQAAACALLPRYPKLQLTLLDQSAQHLPSPEDWSRGLPQPTKLAANALSVPLPDASADIVSCCLFLHHLSPEQTAAFLAESLRLARVAVVINDLERNGLHYALARTFSVVDPSRISRHDGPASVAQAYTYSELDGLLKATGRRYSLRRGFLFRLGAIVWK